MALSTKVGSFQVSTGAVTTTQAITGLGFMPSAILFFWNGRTETVNTIGNATFQSGHGIVTSPTERFCVVGMSQDAVASSVCTKSRRNDACIALSASGATAGLADLQSMDADGFTIIIDQVFTSGVSVGYLALGGTDITSAKAEAIVSAEVGGNADYTTLGFMAAAIILMATGGGTGNDNSGRSNRSIGIAADVGQGTMAAGAQNAQATTRTYRYAYGAECLGIFGTNTPQTRASFVSFLSNGYRLNFLEFAGGPKSVWVLGIAGLNAFAGSLLTRTDTNDIVVTGLGFAPSAIVFLSEMSAQDAQDTPADHDLYSLGLGTALAEQLSFGVRDRHNVVGSSVVTAVNFANVYLDINTATATLDGAMELRSLDSDGFTCRMTTPDPSAKFVMFLALGSAAAAAGRGGITLLGVGT